MTKGKGKRIALWAIGIVAGVLVLALVVINIYVRVAYHTYYSEAQREFNIPGIHDGFVCQDLDYDEDVSVARFYAKLPDGTIYDDHGSAITTTDRYAFLACEDGYLVFDAADLATVSAGGMVSAVSSVDLEITPAFMNVENDTLYAGTFHLIPSYPAPDAHHLRTRVSSSPTPRT